MTVSYLRIRWIAVLTVLAIAVVLSACSDPSAPTSEPAATTTSTPTLTPSSGAASEPTATVPVPTNTPNAAPTDTAESTLASAQSPIYAFASVSAGAGGHTCGVTRDGSVECWGANRDGQATPPSGEFASVSAGNEHTCGVREGWLRRVLGLQRRSGGNCSRPGPRRRLGSSPPSAPGMSTPAG